MKYFIDGHQINSGIQLLKRQVIFKPATDDAVRVANLRIVDTQADGNIIKILLNKQVCISKYPNAFIEFILFSLLYNIDF